MPHGNFAIETLLLKKTKTLPLKAVAVPNNRAFRMHFCFYVKHTPVLDEGGKDLSENNS